MADLELQSVSKSFGAVDVIQGIDLAIERGEFVVFVGPSGCGKSTLLRMIAGLEDVTAGTIRIGGRDVTHAEPSDRGIAMVFQSYALYPHMTVAENMGFGLSLARRPKAEIAAEVGKAARILQLGPLLDRKPKALSGGQRQRVAMAARSCATPGSSCSTNRSRTSTRRCARRCGWSSRTCTRRSARR
jgi:multiple sugar transport system ATP-binding protein